MHNFVGVADCRILLEALPYFLTVDANYSKMTYVNVVAFYAQIEMVLCLFVYCLRIFYCLFVLVGALEGSV